ncbi:MAG TPA: type IV toxin-antitoxin system AbiEi family antitoxin [Verrucomicrobiae bacterium]|nr:type IV toxin-antitoxin system AbiEi family antitoxin [Verrucomicrobiae bacterium]
MDEEVPKRLAELLAVPPGRIKVQREPAAGRGKSASVDMLVSAGKLRFAVECKASGQAASVAMAIRSVREFGEQLGKKSIPLIAVPYMGEVGRRLSEEARVCWLDLSGNAHLVGPGLRVNIEGKPNQFKRPGRPRTVFAPKSARIARWLLMQPERAFTQRQLAKGSGLDEGFTSRIVRQLEEQRLVGREAGGAVKVADYDAMLDGWREAYDFSKHHIVRGHIAARSSDEVVRSLAEQLKSDKVEHAVTGLAGAWLLNQFAGFRLAVVYVGQMPSPKALQQIGFHEEARGENVWLVVPNDEGVFHGAAEREGISCVHPVQVYLDLKNHPERSAAAAEQLRQKLLRKGGHPS